MTSLSVCVPTTGRRASLGTLLESIRVQLLPGDELMVDVSDNEPFGYPARQRMLAKAKSEFVIFMDDDDYYLPDSFEVIRAGVATAPSSVHLFRMRWEHNGELIWRDPVLRESNVASQIVAVPRGCPGIWGTRYAGDYDFIKSSCDALGPPVFHPEVIASIGIPFAARGGTYA